MLSNSVNSVKHHNKSQDTISSKHMQYDHEENKLYDSLLAKHGCQSANGPNRDRVVIIMKAEYPC